MAEKTSTRALQQATRSRQAMKTRLQDPRGMLDSPQLSSGSGMRSLQRSAVQPVNLKVGQPGGRAEVEAGLAAPPAKNPAQAELSEE